MRVSSLRYSVNTRCDLSGIVRTHMTDTDYNQLLIDFALEQFQFARTARSRRHWARRARELIESITPRQTDRDTSGLINTADAEGVRR